jgi:hypothetical protein
MPYNVATTISSTVACSIDSSMSIIVMHRCVGATPRQLPLLLLLLQAANLICITNLPAQPTTAAITAHTSSPCLSTFCCICPHTTAVIHTPRA